MTTVFDSLSRKGPDDSSGRKSPDPVPGGAAATPSVIGSGMKLVGDLTARGDLRIEGQVEGSVKTEGEVVIASQATVEGDVEGREVIVGGRMKGTLTAKRAARMEEGCQVDAEIRAPAVSIQEGGIVNGKLVMGK